MDAKQSHTETSGNISYRPVQNSQLKKKKMSCLRSFEPLTNWKIILTVFFCCEKISFFTRLLKNIPFFVSVIDLSNDKSSFKSS